MFSPSEVLAVYAISLADALIIAPNFFFSSSCFAAPKSARPSAGPNSR